MGARRMHKCDGLYVGDEGDPLVGIREMHRPVAGTGDVVASGGIRDVEMAKYDPSRLNEKGVVPRGTSYRSERPLRRLRRRFPFIFAARGAGAPPRVVLITHLACQNYRHAHRHADLRSTSDVPVAPGSRTGAALPLLSLLSPFPFPFSTTMPHLPLERPRVGYACACRRSDARRRAVWLGLLNDSPLT